MLQNSTGTVLQYKGMSVIDSRNVATKYDFTISDGSNVESKFRAGFRASNSSKDAFSAKI